MREYIFLEQQLDQVMDTIVEQYDAPAVSSATCTAWYQGNRLIAIYEYWGIFRYLVTMSVPDFDLPCLIPLRWTHRDHITTTDIEVVEACTPINLCPKISGNTIYLCEGVGSLTLSGYELDARLFGETDPIILEDIMDIFWRLKQ